FEILSISLDKADKAEHLAKFTKEHNMPWRQIYDGMYWDARIA
ncbi:MAG: TlpA family protein disulfide reductase, partial [Armatimonadetes bacterium]|nr:TlpA family protein disulfide reductase [Armatimonadota bacterium]